MPPVETGKRGRSPSPSLPTRTESAVALVITLIMLAVITFMAITFLVVSRSERGAVTTSLDTAAARLGADSALERAKIELIAPMMAFSNQFSSSLIVSTNFINPLGFERGNPNPTNVNFDYEMDPRGNRPRPLTQLEQWQNLANLLYNPRVPVYIRNRVAGSNDFRFYLDLNRNGLFDPSGALPVVNDFNKWIQSTNGFLTNTFVGDPQWIGALEFPDRPHSANNRFLFRYAYAAVPVSTTLDANYIHNYAKANPLNGAMNVGDMFLRNQGVGTWEINLAAFFVDLNPRIWPYPGPTPLAAPYLYTPDLNLANRGAAFDDAWSFVSNRYAGNWRANLQSVRAKFGNSGVSAFRSDYIDGYTHGPVMTGTWWPGAGIDPDTTLIGLGWPGSENPYHYFTPQDFFDPRKTSVPFVNRMQMASTNVSSSDRYTYYRLLSQLGTESSPETGRLNLNYVNVDNQGNIVSAMATNFTPWRPDQFFTNAANRLLANAGFNMSVANIPVWPTNNFYTPSIHQLLQMAANIYDATTNRTGNLRGGNLAQIPTVFRPIFRRFGPFDVRIVGYREVTTTAMADIPAGSAPRMVDLDTGANVGLLHASDQPFAATSPNELDEPMVKGIPLVIGARKGLPNFNEMAMLTHVYISRLLEFRRDSAGKLNETNQMYVMAITNVFGVEAWNSYTNAYPRNLDLVVAAEVSESVTNEFGVTLHTNYVGRTARFNNPANSWQGWINANYPESSFRIPLHPSTNWVHFMENSTYQHNAARPFIPQTHIFQRGAGFYVPRWTLNLSAELRFILVDRDAQRIVDYVNIKNRQEPLDIISKLSEDATCSNIAPGPIDRDGDLWCTNRQGSLTDLRIPTIGIRNQIKGGMEGAGGWKSFVMDPTAGNDMRAAIDSFRYQLGFSPLYYAGRTYYRSNVFYAPLDPYRPIFIQNTLQANDPLVHYTAGDLKELQATNNVTFQAPNPSLPNIGRINTRFQPWGGNPAGGSSSPAVGPYDLAAKDPLVTRSDFWEFPTNKFANIGWLGRVHRGSPWQTLNLKGTNLNLGLWRKWSGNGMLVRNVGQINTNMFPNLPLGAVTNDAAFTMPGNDMNVLDLFTTAFNDNATRSRLSINQSDIASWSAVLSGVNVMPDNTTNTFIQPAGVYDPLTPPAVAKIVDGINRRRAAQPDKTFHRLGEIVSVPELSVASPFLNTARGARISDAVYERIPQQILGLLRCDETPRYVIYSYGQALKPADRSILTSGPYRGMCTNYQITAEVATRAVVRVEGAPGHPHVVVEKFTVLPPD
jgi:hypothetical protein